MSVQNECFVDVKKLRKLFENVDAYNERRQNGSCQGEDTVEEPPNNVNSIIKECAHKRCVENNNNKSASFRGARVSSMIKRFQNQDKGQYEIKLKYIINEMKETEKNYIQDLTWIVGIYNIDILHNTPPELQKYCHYLFGNIVEIYESQKEFFLDLQSGYDADSIAQIFSKHESLFRKYPHYFKNKRKADKTLKEFQPIIRKIQEGYKHRLDLSSYLLTPVQRLGKYILFLQDILKVLVKFGRPTENTEKALGIVKEAMSKGNDLVAIQSIQNSPVDVSDYGTYISQETFKVSKPDKFEAVAFLFTNVVVITIIDQYEKESFNYFDHIMMADLVTAFENLTISLTNYAKSKQGKTPRRYTYTLNAKDERTFKLWQTELEGLLWKQYHFMKENTLKRYSKQLQ